MVIKKSKQGAASYYTIMVCAILFGVIVTGFIVLMIDEMKKSTEYTLAQSAYDAAVAGVEDAKILMMEYNGIKTKESNGDPAHPGQPYTLSDTEQIIVNAVENSGDQTTTSEGTEDGVETKPICNDVGGALGRPGVSTGDGYLVQETGSTGSADDESTVEAYTCVILDRRPLDYLGTLTSSNPIRVIPLQGVNNKIIRNIRISWYSIVNLGTQSPDYRNQVKDDDTSGAGITVDRGGGTIRLSDTDSTPPTIVAQIYQANDTFSANNFNDPTNNRGTLWLFPSDADSITPTGATEENYKQELSKIDGNYFSDYYDKWAWDYYEMTAPDLGLSSINTEYARTTILNENAYIDSNSKEPDISHRGFPVRCAKQYTNPVDGTTPIDETIGLDYLCSVVINLPENGDRSLESGVFSLVLSLPYGQQATDFRVQMSTADGDGGFRGVVSLKDGTMYINHSTTDADTTYLNVEFDNVQIAVDSTGRANDVYARVESRVELYDSSFPFPDYTVTLGNPGATSAAFWKDFYGSTATGSGCWWSVMRNGSLEDHDTCLPAASP